MLFGRFEREKGFFDLIDVFKNIVKVKPEYKLILVGDGSLKNQIQEKIINEGLEKNVELTGFIKKEKLNELYKKAKIYLMTSFEESFGLVAAEAQSYKIPVITFSSATGVVELLDGSGIVVKNRDKNKMADETINLINDSERYKREAENSYLNSKRFSEEIVKKEWLDFLNNL